MKACTYSNISERHKKEQIHQSTEDFLKNVLGEIPKTNCFIGLVPLLSVTIQYCKSANHHLQPEVPFSEMLLLYWQYQ